MKEITTEILRLLNNPEQWHTDSCGHFIHTSGLEISCFVCGYNVKHDRKELSLGWMDRYLIAFKVGKTKKKLAHTDTIQLLKKLNNPKNPQNIVDKQ
jgi:hypothetical protein